MRHRVSGRKLGRTKDQRKLLFRSLMGELILRGRVKTTIAKAKTIAPLVDKLITKAKKMNLSGKREVVASLPQEAAAILISHIAPHFKDRTSGFSRIVRLSGRSGDNAEMVFLEWVEEIKVKRSIKSIKGTKSKEPEETKGTKEPEEAKAKTPRKRRVSKKA